MTDVHTSTAAKLFKVPLAEVTPEQRQVAKARNYWWLYSNNNFQPPEIQLRKKHD
jgi:DNA polymerase I-like protein with 3'-5' exonuclease and polymerase domains